jgi:hypothetical protein
MLTPVPTAILARAGLRWVAMPGAVTCTYWAQGTRIHLLSLRAKHMPGPSVATACEFLVIDHVEKPLGN